MRFADQHLIGVPEVPSGSSSPSRGPPLAATAVTHSGSKNARARRGGAAFTITEQCERLFCKTLEAIFLGEGGLASHDLLVIGAVKDSIMDSHNTTKNAPAVRLVNPAGLPSSEKHAILTDWLEMYDYAGGTRFRGYVAEGAECRSMFVFFDDGVLGNDLKPG